MPKSIYTVKEVAKLLGFSTNTVYKYLDDGIIKAVRLGSEGRFRIPAGEVERLLQEQGKSLSSIASQSAISPALSAEIKDSPTVFDWFIGFVSMGVGFSQFVNPLYPNSYQSLVAFVPYINIISLLLFVNGALLLGFDIFKSRTEKYHRHIGLNISAAVFYLSLAFIFLSQKSVTAIAFMSIGFILIISVLRKKLDYYSRYVTFINIFFVLIGIGFLFWPKSFGFPQTLSLDISGKLLFSGVWLVLSLLLIIISVRGLRKNGKYIKNLSFAVGAVSIAYAIFCFSNGYWERSVIAIILGTFSFIFPYAHKFDTFRTRTKKESVISFLWLLGVFFVGSIVLQMVNRSFQKIILDEMQKRAVTASSITGNFMDSKISILSGTISENGLPELIASGVQSDALDAKIRQIYLSSNNSFNRIVVTDKDGKIIDTYPFYLPSQNVDISNRDYFQMPASTKHTFVTDLEQPNSPGINPQIMISFPIIDKNDNFVGVILGAIDTSELQNRLETTNSNDSGSFIVLDSKGNYILNPSPQTDIISAPEDSLAVKAMQLETGSEVGHGNEGILKYMAYQKIENYGWTVVITQPLSTSLKMYSLMGFAAFLFFIMATVGSLSLVMFLRKNK